MISLFFLEIDEEVSAMRVLPRCVSLQNYMGKGKEFDFEIDCEWLRFYLLSAMMTKRLELFD